MFRRFASALSLIAILQGSAALAQTPVEYNLGGAARAKDLVLPTEVSDIASATAPVMALYKPDGGGPFPALVLLHQCGGLRPNGNPNMSMLDWAKTAVARGYAVLQLDALAQRGADTLCFGPQKDIAPSRGALDALQAAAHLRKLPFVDKDRVALAGFSWGGGIALLVGSSQTAKKLNQSQRYNAVVSSYPACVAHPRDGTPPYTTVLSGIDRPLLAMFGGRDTETVPGDCIPLLDRQKQAGAPIEWHVYPEATHCWDCASMSGRKFKDIRGNINEYLYDGGVTRDQTERMFDFIETAFKARR